MQVNHKNVIAILLGVVIGFYITLLLVSNTPLELDSKVVTEISPIEIFSIVINIILAVYITRNLSKKNESEKSEKEMIIQYLKDFKVDLSEKTTYLLAKSELATPQTNSDFKILRKRLNMILSFITEFDLLPNNNFNQNQLKDKLTELWELFTNIPAKANDGSSEEIKNDIEKIRLEKGNKIEMTIIEIEKRLFRISMQIQRG